MKWCNSSCVVLGAAMLIFGVAIAQAETIEMVTVGNPGNANDSTGYGGVDHTYQIGKYEVTNAQYTEFLNGVPMGPIRTAFTTTAWAAATAESRLLPATPTVQSTR